MNSLSPPPYIKDSVSINDNNYDIGGNMIGIDPIITRIPTNTKPYFQNEHLPPDYNNILHDGNIIHQNNNINDNINNTEADIIINGICQNNKSVLDICKNAVYFLNNIVKCLNLIFAFNNIFYILYFKTYYILLSIFITISINQLLRKYNPLSIFLLGIITITDLSIKTSSRCDLIQSS